MKKSLVFIVAVLFITNGFSQYLKPVITPESSPGACDASIKLIPIGLNPPYSFQWVDGNHGWAVSNGLQLDGSCSAEEFRAVVTDANCYKVQTWVYIDPDPTKQIFLDTVIITHPTPGNNNGTLQFVFQNVPAGYSRHFYAPNSGSSVVGSTFINLGQGEHGYSIQYNNQMRFLVHVSLRSSPPTPCFTFKTSFTSNFTNTTDGIPNSGCDPSFTIPHSNSGCDGNFTILSEGVSGSSFRNWVFYHYGFNSDLMVYKKNQPSFVDSLCNGAYSIYTFNNVGGFNVWSDFKSLFVNDSLTTENYLWNAPDTILTNTDTLMLDALDIPSVKYYLPVDTVFISEIKYLNHGQFHITASIVQQTDTFNMYYTEFLDSTNNYLFDLTVYEADSIWCSMVHAQRHFVYWEWPPCDSVVICHVSPGNPNVTVTITVPCDDVDDHIGNHANDYLGPCYSSAAVQHESPTDAGHNQNGKKVNAQEPTLYLFPNPFNENIQLRSSVTVQRVEFISLDGKTVLMHTVNSTSAILNTDNLLPSAYFIKIYFAEQPAEMRRLVKMK